MPASGALGPFLDAMMKLRAQRLEEQEAKDKGMMALGQGIAGGVQSLGKGLTEGMTKQRQDALANKLGGDPNAAWQGGGKEEIELRKAMGQYDASKGITLYQQELLKQKALDRKVAEGQRDAQLDRYDQAQFGKASDKFRQSVQDSQAAAAKQRNILTKMQDPEKDWTTSEWGAMADELRAVNSGIMSQGLSIDTVPVPRYQSADEKAALARYQAAQAKAIAPVTRGGIESTPGIQSSGAWNQVRPSQGPTLAYEKAAQSFGPGGPPSAEPLPYGAQYTYTGPVGEAAPEYAPQQPVPPTAPTPRSQQPGQPAQQAGQYKLGQRAQFPDKTIRRWNGSQWVIEK
jgi:hypothetical protein